VTVNGKTLTPFRDLETDNILEMEPEEALFACLLIAGCRSLELPYSRSAMSKVILDSDLVSESTRLEITKFRAKNVEAKYSVLCANDK
jgi:hypothetical protein